MNNDRAFILNDMDVLQAGDFARPLELEYTGQSDYLATTNTYGGTPMNHMRWVQLERLELTRWIGKTVLEFNTLMDSLSKPHQPYSHYEFCRGALSKDHVLPPTEKEKHKQTLEKVMPRGKYKGKTVNWVRTHDPEYFSWMDRVGFNLGANDE